VCSERRCEHAARLVAPLVGDLAAVREFGQMQIAIIRQAPARERSSAAWFGKWRLAAAATVGAGAKPTPTGAGA
jgi:hypothetical protein